MKNRIHEQFAKLKQEKRIAFMPFIVAGDPNFQKSLALAQQISANADFIEVGFPYSDPLADGPTIQQADMRAIRSGMDTDKVFELIKLLRKTTDIPVTVLVYANLVYQRGIDRFYKDAAAAGIDAVLIPDVPIEEIEDFHKFAKKFRIQQIFLVSQTTTNQRLQKILKLAEGYLYLVSVLGITGARTGVVRETLELISRVKKQTNLPIVIGFGVSSPDHVRTLKKAGAEGAIVGSALINFIHKKLQQIRFKNKLNKHLKSFRV